MSVYSKVPSPSFVMDEVRLRQNLSLLHHIKQQSGATIILAMKSFAMHAVFPIMAEYLDGATASSWGEAKAALMHLGKDIQTYCPVYHPDEFDQLAEVSSHITFNSLSQWEEYKTRLGSASAGIRINPEYAVVQTDLYNPSAPGSRLGVDIAQMPPELPEGMDGLHFHTLFEDGVDALERVVEAVEQKFGKYLHQAKWLNMGGGHAITRKGYDTERLIRLIKRLKAQYNLEVVLEPGTAATWRTGELVATVLDIVENQGIKTAMLDVSFTAHMPDCLEMPYRPEVMGATASHDAHARYAYRLGGNSCLSGDFMGGNDDHHDGQLAYYEFAAPLAVGQRIVFEDMMHYTMVKTTMFNGVKHPSIMMQRSDGELMTIREYTAQDFLDRMGGVSLTSLGGRR